MSQPDTRDTQYTYERFKWTILGDAATEDVQGVWEPLWELRSCYEIPGLSETERQDMVDRALRELFADGLIYFFRGGRPGQLNQAADDPSARLTSEEVDETLKSDWWRGPATLPHNHPNVWWCATEKGETTYMNAPEDIRAFWEGRGQKEAEYWRNKQREKGAPG